MLYAGFGGSPYEGCLRTSRGDSLRMSSGVAFRIGGAGNGPEGGAGRTGKLKVLGEDELPWPALSP